MRRALALCAIAAILLLAIFTPHGLAQDALPPAPYAYRQLDDPAQEAAAQELMETIRCLTCQSQSIADSDAPKIGRASCRERVSTSV